ncbi:Uncharacterised protein g583 [Pycnogonum litorale]
MKGPIEKIIYVPCIIPKDLQIPDYLATVDINPESPTFCQVLHRLPMLHVGDELHRSGWNSCSSCFGNPGYKRDKLILPCLISDRVYIVDTGTDPLAPTIHRTIEPEEIHELKLGAPHTPHCLASGEIMISCMGDENENAKGSYMLIDGKTFKLKGTWQDEKYATGFGYDFWYQPRRNVILSSVFVAPKAFRKGFDPDHVKQGKMTTLEFQ